MKKRLALIAAVLLGMTANAQVTTGLLCHYKLDNNFVDDSGNGLNALANGTYSFTEDRNGNANSALQLFNTPSVGYVQSVFPGTVNQNDSTFTFAFWYNSTKTQTQTFPQVASMGYAVTSVVQNTAFADSSQFNFSLQSDLGTYSTINLILDTNWNHLAFTLDVTGNLKAYVNGTFTDELTMNSNKLNYTIGGLMLSNFQSNSANNGDIYDDIYVYTRDLNASEVLQVYNGNSACTVTIPDANFKGYLVANTNININADSEIQCTEAAAYSGTINVTNLGITDLTGIEAFTNITTLLCGANTLSTIDVGNNVNLNALNCASTGLSSLDVTNLTVLDTLYCAGNGLTSLDVSNCIELKLLECHINNITSLDISQNPALEFLNCASNNISTLDFNNNTAITHIDAGLNNLTSVSNLQSAPLVDYLRLRSNDLTTIDVSSNTALDYIDVGNNDITDLDFSPNTAATIIYVFNNQLTSLNLQNGNNTNMINFESTGNPNLPCIQVDDSAYSTTNWTAIDPTSSFSENCFASVSELHQNDAYIYPNPTKNLLHIEVEGVFENAIILDSSGKVVKTSSSKSFSINDIASGVYMIQVTTEHGTIHQRIVKQ